ncbi:MAG: ShlB/FhaC/HecB family hemolysin secretion/activation protein [Inquilinaceae bacterium]
MISLLSNKYYLSFGNYRIFLFFLFFLTLICPTPLLSQSLPPGASPDRTIRIPDPPTPRLTPGAPDGSIVPRIQPPPAQEAPVGTVALRSIQISGVSVYDETVLRPLYADLLGREISFSEIYGVANRLTARYHADGYALSQAFVPGQEVTDGTVRIWVVEGALASFRIEGDAGGNRDVIERYARRLLRSRPLRTADLERYLLLMNDLPGAAVTGFVVPGDQGLANAELVLSASAKATSGFVGLDNRGSRFFGRGQAYATFQANAPFGAGELIEVSPIVTGPGDGPESLGGFVNVRVPVFANGAYVQGFLAGSETKPGGFLDSLDLRGQALIGTLAYGYPLSRTIDRYVYATGQIDIIETEEDISRDQPFIEDSLRVARGTLSLGQADRWGGETFGDVRLSVGIDALGASDGDDPLRSRINADGGFVAVRGSVLRRQSLDAIADNLRIVAGVSGQYSADPLLSGEEFGVGGPVYGQAYDYYDIAGDYGIAARTELQYGLPTAQTQAVNAAELFAFYDIGKVWNHDPLTFEIDNGSLASLGGGVRVTMVNRVVGSISVAKPLTRDVTAEGDRDLRYFVRVGVAW